MIELVISLIILIIFGVTDSRLATDLSDGYSGNKTQFGAHFYYFLQAFFVAGLIEEYCKGFLLQYSMKLYIHHPKYLNYLDIETICWLGLAVGSGFGTMEGVLYTCLYGGGTSFVSQVILWLVRTFVAIPFHTIMGILWGCELSKRDALKYNQVNVAISNYSSQESNNSDRQNAMAANSNNMNNNNNNRNININVGVRRDGCCMEWIKLGIKQVLWHGCYDFIEMEFSLLTASSNTMFEIEMAIVGCIIALIITVGAGLMTKRTYSRLINSSRTELIPDDVDDHL